MLSQDEFQQLIGEITAAEFPAESISFRLSGKHKVQQLYAKGEAAPNTNNAQDLLPFAGGAESTVVLEFIKLAAGTLLTSLGCLASQGRQRKIRGIDSDHTRERIKTTLERPPH